jgi:pimeloyl-ACP methyl ester carboxylesterase
VRPVFLPAAERLGRLALTRAGVSTRLVRTPLGRVHAYDAKGSGDLPTTILLHGLGSAATPFAPVLARLQRHVRRVVAPDYPGHGFSELEPDARAAPRLTPEALFDSVSHALDELAPEPAVVVGNSLGGAVALHYALTRPERVRAVVLLSPAGAHATDEEWHELRRAFDVTTRSSARAFVDRIYHRPPWFLSLLAHEFPATLARKPIRDLLETASNEHAPAPAALRALPMPVLLVWGKSERLLPETHLRWFEQHLPAHAVIERPEGFGHCPHFDAPGAVTRRIVSFIREADQLQRSAAVG